MRSIVKATFVLGTVLVLASWLATLVQAQEGSREAAPAPPTSISTPVSIERPTAPPPTLGERLRSVVGLFCMVGIAFGLSRNRSAIDWRMVGWGITLQVSFGMVVLWTAPGRWLFTLMNDFFTQVLEFTNAGSSFLFGKLIDIPSMGVIFAFRILPSIIFFSSLMAVLYYLGIVQKVVYAMAVAMQKTMRTSGAESLSAAANVFVGQTEAPLVVKPYVEQMTNSELMALMTGGMATVAGGVLAAYVGMGLDAGHLLTASVMSAPAALLIAKVLVPETKVSHTAGSVKMDVPVIDANVIDAAARGAGEGLNLAMNVGAMLLAFIALIAMVNHGIGILDGWIDKGRAGIWAGCLEVFGFEVFPDSLESLCGYLCAPLAWIMGVPGQDAFQIGQLLGVKTVLNEFVAYQKLGEMMAPTAAHQLAPRSVIIATYALCGFANFGSIAIQIGGIGGIAPNRRQDLARLGLLSMIGGTLAAFMTATVAGFLL